MVEVVVVVLEEVVVVEAVEEVPVAEPEAAAFAVVEADPDALGSGRQLPAYGSSAGVTELAVAGSPPARQTTGRSGAETSMYLNVVR